MDKLAVLQQKNQKLAVQLEEKRKENRELEHKLANYEAKEQEYAQTLLCVRRLWEQLNADVQHMCSQLPSSTQDAAASTPKQEQEQPACAVNGLADPYLTRLLSGADEEAVLDIQASCKELHADSTEVEKVLQANSTTTKKALASLLDTVLALQAHQGGLAAPPAAPPPPEPPVDGQQPMDTDQQPPQPVDAATKEVDTRINILTAENRLLKEQVQHKSDRLLEAFEQKRRLEQEAADYQQALSSAQRKLLTLQNTSNADGGQQGDGSAAGGVPASRAPSGSLQPAPSMPAPEPDEDLTAIIAKREAELDQEREEHLKTTRLLAAAQAKLQEDTAWITTTPAFLALTAELTAAREQLEARTKELEALVHEKEAVDARAGDRFLLAQRESYLSGKLTQLTQKVSELTIAKVIADTAKLEAEAMLQHERQLLANSQSAAELRVMLGMLKGELDLKQQELKQAKEAGTQLAAYSSEVQASRAAAAGLQADIQQLKHEVVELQGAVQEGKRREEAWREKVDDLQAYVDILTAYLSVDDAVQQLATAQGRIGQLTSRCSSLQSQLDTYTASGQLSAVQQAEAKAAEKTAKAAADARAAHAELAAARAQVEVLSKQLANARAECELYIQEVESTSSAYEETSAQNQRLADVLATKEEQAAALQAEKAKMAATISRLEEAVEKSRIDAEQQSRDLSHAAVMREATEKEVARLSAEMAMVKEQLRVQGLRAAGLEAEVRRRDEAAAALTAQLSTTQQSLAAQREQLVEETEKATRERNKRQRLEDENKLLNARLGKLRRAGSTAGADELNEEVEAMRKLLNCNVCHERQKNVIITKCCHVFCDKCIKRNLEARNRKCPGCGAAFGQADVRQFFFT